MRNKLNRSTEQMFRLLSAHHNKKINLRISRKTKIELYLNEKMQGLLFVWKEIKI